MVLDPNSIAVFNDAASMIDNHAGHFSKASIDALRIDASIFSHLMNLFNSTGQERNRMSLLLTRIEIAHGLNEKYGKMMNSSSQGIKACNKRIEAINNLGYESVGATEMLIQFK